MMDNNNKELRTFEKYAIFKTGGKQYQAIEGRTLEIEKIEGEPGDILELNNVLLRRLSKDKIEVGQPVLEGAKIRCSIVKQTKGPKVIAFRFKRRKKVRVKRGHRQSHTIIRVEAI